MKNKDTTILLVDDELDILEIIEYNLSAQGYNVVTALNGVQAIKKAKKHKPKLIILDVMMPEMDGFEFAEKLRENKDWLDIPVVVITAKDLTSADHKRLKGNVEAIMQKGSYSKKELMSEVGNRIKLLKKRS